MTDPHDKVEQSLLPVTPDEERCDICCRPREQHVGSDLQCNETTYFRPMPAQSHSLPGDVGMREALERIRARASEWTPPEGLEARIAWIEAELDDEPNRPLYGNGDVPCCRTGHEVSELIAEHAGLVARAALTPSPLHATQEDAERSGAGGVDVVSSFEQLRDLADDTLMEAEAVRYNAGDIEKVQDALIDMGSIARDALDALEATPQRQEYDGEAVSAVDAFEMGYVFGMALRGQNLEDSRAVGRLLMADSFKPIHDGIDAAIKEFGFDSFQSADSGICQAKRIIRAALAHPAQARDEMRGENERLRRALKPFAVLASVGDAGKWMDVAGFTLMHHHEYVGCLTLEHLREARAALSSDKGEER